MARPQSAPRPELEHELLRKPDLGFEPPGTGIVRCLEHAEDAWPLHRWNYHDEYELQAMPRSPGRAFVGDSIDHFDAGYVALVGPRVPHNWISAQPEDALHLVMHFHDTPLRQAMAVFPDLADVMPLLDRSRHGVQFFGLSELFERRFYEIKSSGGTARLGLFMRLLSELAHWPDYRLLSSVPMQYSAAAGPMHRLNGVLDYLNAHYHEDLTIGDVSRVAGMADASFSRYFKRSMGNSLTDFLNRLRVSKACHLLQSSDRYISDVCYEVGFRNLANFNRRFLQIKGMTPSEYRRRFSRA